MELDEARRQIEEGEKERRQLKEDNQVLTQEKRAYHDRLESLVSTS